MRLKRAICRLPNTLRSVVELGQMEGHSMKQIAHNMGISVPATKSRLARAKVALRKSRHRPIRGNSKLIGRRKGDVMDWRDKVANGFVVKPGVTQPPSQQTICRFPYKWAATADGAWQLSDVTATLI